MSNIRRLFVEKKDAFAVEAHGLLADLRNNLGMSNLTGMRIVNRYDVMGLSDEEFAMAKQLVLSEPPVDNVVEEELPLAAGEAAFAVELLPGQYDQREDFAEQCIQLITQKERPMVAAAKVYVLEGKLTAEEVEKIKAYCINPIEAREAEQAKPETLISTCEEPEKVKSVTGFLTMSKEEAEALRQSMGLAMSLDDLLWCQKYFNEEHREPTITEIRVLDTYWSDHCRHTTFMTQIEDVDIVPGTFTQPVQEAYDKYMAARDEVYGEDTERPVTLMDIAVIGMKKLRKEGKLADLDQSEEINACSIVVPIEIDGKTEEWLVMFKNETHNHPTEIEPFGGAATCLGGAIRDPLSGRSYVYQAMRVTGSADPRTPISETLPGKLPQRKITIGAAAGYSSYGNQIGLATGHVQEYYHDKFVAKRMEIGGVIGAAPRSAVRRERPAAGDIVVLLGGKTGRDGCGGATGSSKEHTVDSLMSCGAEVQKGNPPTERKIQRLFRNPAVTAMIKRCNDFGAGGVSVAIGELTDGLVIDLDKVPKKYAGLDGTELAISESQERMAVVVSPKDVDTFLGYAAEENLEAVPVAVVTKEPRLVLNWRGKSIVNLSRAFLDTNGAHQETDVTVTMPSKAENYMEKVEVKDNFKDTFTDTLKDLNVCSKKGLVEMFDSSIGAGTVTMPFGGKTQLTPIQTMTAKLPVLEGKTEFTTMMSYGFDPYLSSWSPYHGAVYAVTESIAKIVAAGGDYRKIRFTFQEYFRRMTEDPKRWSQPFAALLGAYAAQMGFGLPSIGGKDSMSGTFNDIDVPPTLVSFAVDVAKIQDVITPELKKAGNKLVWLRAPKDQYDLPDYAGIMDQYEKLHKDMQDGKVVSAYALDRHGIAAAVAKMAFGNGMGVKIEHNLDPRDFFAPGFGDIILEVPDGKVGELSITYTVIGEVTADGNFSYGNTVITVDEAENAWKGTLEKVFKTVSSENDKEAADRDEKLYRADSIYVCKNKVAKPRVFIPVFPGTNCEYDSTRAFERAGAEVDVKVFKNLTAEDIHDSVELFEKAIDQAQIIMFPGGFSAGDEPDGSAKFFATAFQNAKIKEAVMKLINERDGLALGICNGFQALIKLGLVPYGEICGQKADSPTLTFNTIGRHISKMVYTKVVTNKSPWLQGAELGGVYTNPASHGEGRFVASEEWLDRLFANGQVATQYCDPEGKISMNEEWNVNGSYRAIEGITSPDGRVLGKMAHSERRGDHVAINIYGEQDLKIFESGVKYFK